MANPPRGRQQAKSVLWANSKFQSSKALQTPNGKFQPQGVWLIWSLAFSVCSLECLWRLEFGVWGSDATIGRGRAGGGPAPPSPPADSRRARPDRSGVEAGSNGSIALNSTAPASVRG